MRTVSALAEGRAGHLSSPPRWLDIACGGGFHLRNADGDLERIGLDRSKAMLDVARARRGHEARFIQCDVLDERVMLTVPNADIVTHFWFGYVHQRTPERCMAMILAMATKVRSGGCFLLGVNSIPLDVPRQVAMAFRTVTIDSVQWRFREPEGYGYGAMNCLHPDWIIGTVTPRFRTWRWLDYPAERKRTARKRRALLFSGTPVNILPHVE